MTIDEQLAEWRKVCDAATPGPWYEGGPHPTVSVVVCVDGGCSDPNACPEPPRYEPICILYQHHNYDESVPPQALTNADFIVTSRTVFPRAIAAIEEIRFSFHQQPAIISAIDHILAAKLAGEV